MWLWLSVFSACLLGVYDVAKKKALQRNSVLWVLFGATFLSAVFLSPTLSPGPLRNHLMLIVKAFLVSSSWISGLAALKYIPITTASPIKATRPVIVVLFSILLFGERLNLWQWAGVVLVFTALYLLSRSSKSEGIDFSSNKGIMLMVVSVITGSASALYDKHILQTLEPLFVQSWTNIYISAVLALCILIKALRNRENREKFHWDWTIVLIAVLISISDCAYFFAVNEEDALLSVISLIRRGSVAITFALGAVVFKEQNIRSKALSLGIMLGGIVLLMLGSSIV